MDVVCPLSFILFSYGVRDEPTNCALAAVRASIEALAVSIRGFAALGDDAARGGIEHFL